MGKIIYSTMVSLDGFIAGPNGSLDWVTIDDEIHTFVNDRVRAGDTFLYGRRIYELMAADWPQLDADPSNPGYIIDFAKIWKEKPKIVVSKTLQQVAWKSTLVRDPTAEEITRLKAEPGRDLMLGGAELAGEYLRLGWIDEYQLYVNPVVLGEGLRMIPEQENSIPLRLMETKTFRSGVMYLRYQPAGGK